MASIAFVERCAARLANSLPSSVPSCSSHSFFHVSSIPRGARRQQQRRKGGGGGGCGRVSGTAPFYTAAIQTSARHANSESGGASSLSSSSTRTFSAFGRQLESSDWAGKELGETENVDPTPFGMDEKLNEFEDLDSSVLYGPTGEAIGAETPDFYYNTDPQDKDDPESAEIDLFQRDTDSNVSLGGRSEAAGGLENLSMCGKQVINGEERPLRGDQQKRTESTKLKDSENRNSDQYNHQRNTNSDSRKAVHSPGRTKLLKAIHMGDADEVASLIKGNAIGDGYRRLPAPTFSELIRLYLPKEQISAAIAFYSSLTPSVVTGLALRGLPSILEEVSQRIQNSLNMLRLRSLNEVPVSEEDYRYLLDCASTAGILTMTRLTFHHLLHRGFEPDVQCYNAYLEAIIWNQVHIPGFGALVRNTPDNVLARSAPMTKETVKARDRVVPKFNNYRLGEGGIVDDLKKLFKRVLTTDKGIPDTRTYALFIAGCGRSGNLHMANKILKKIWNVDVADLQQQRELGPAKPYASSSPRYPTEELLYSIAHAFGSNDDVPTAMSLVAYISEQYDVPISVRVWYELLFWTYEISKPGKKRTPTRGLPAVTILQLWDVMTSEPYNIHPSPPMWRLLFVYLSRWTPYHSKEMMRGAIQEFALTCRAQRNMDFNPLENALQDLEWLRQHGYDVASSELARLRREQDRALNHKRLSHLFLKLAVTHFFGRPFRREEVNLAPEFIREFAKVVPNMVRYRVPGGTVEFAVRHHEGNERRHQRWRSKGVAFRRYPDWIDGIEDPAVREAEMEKHRRVSRERRFRDRVRTEEYNYVGDEEEAMRKRQVPRPHGPGFRGWREEVL